ncbi:MAG: hypothetical protein H6718_22700 [Polyangiaceae bacterium]|nr:hypothetical protein [Polyangiaceae bacterium]
MADPVNRVMLLGADALPGPALKRHATEAVRVFLAAYGKPAKPGSLPRGN